MKRRNKTVVLHCGTITGKQWSLKIFFCVCKDKWGLTVKSLPFSYVQHTFGLLCGSKTPQQHETQTLLVYFLWLAAQQAAKLQAWWFASIASHYPQKEVLKGITTSLAGSQLNAGNWQNSSIYCDSRRSRIPPSMTWTADICCSCPCRIHSHPLLKQRRDRKEGESGEGQLAWQQLTGWQTIYIWLEDQLFLQPRH